MRDIEGDMLERDGRLGDVLRDVVSDAELDDVRFERLARRIDAAAGSRLRQARVARHSVRMQWMGSVVSAGLAASAVLALVLMHGSIKEPVGTFGGESVVAGTDVNDQGRDNRGELFAASVGEISEEEFLANVGGQVDATAFLASDQQ